MAPESPPALVEFSTTVPSAELERFNQMLPIYGAKKWFLSEALTRFNDELEKNPDLVIYVSRAVERMTAETRSRLTER